MQTVTNFFRCTAMIRVVLFLATITIFTTTCDAAFSFPSPPPSWTHVLEHLLSPSPPLRATSLEELANVRIPGPPGSNVDILAFEATPTGYDQDAKRGEEQIHNSVILIHEFFGLNPSIAEKARGLAEDLGCVVIAPDTFRGTVTDFIPRAIWLALSTPQDRVDDDLDAVCSYLKGKGGGGGKLAVMGFCYGGGKAIRYACNRRNDAATVVFYGSPETDVDRLRRLNAPVCGIFGGSDAQFPRALVDKFRSSLDEAGVEGCDVRMYDGVGHAFWSDMDQVRRGDQPQAEAYEQCTSFLRAFLSGD